MRRPPLPPRARRALLTVSFASVVSGGLLLWIAFFLGAGQSALAIGAAATLLPIYAFARRDRARRPLTFMLGFAFAFALLTWPILWLVVGYARYLLTGQTLGD